MRAAVLSTLAFTASLASAHFEVLYPPYGGEFSDEEQATSPCGGFVPEINDQTADVQVDRFALSVRSSHPAGHWAFRATTSTSAPYNFTDITMVDSEGVGEFCLTHFSVPAEYAGSSGVIQIVDDGHHGQLYSCVPVNFVEGANSTVGPACTNATGFTATYASESSSDSHDHDHSHGDESSTTSAGSEEASATAGGASSSSVPGAAAMATGMGAVAGLGMVVAGLVL